MDHSTIIIGPAQLLKAVYHSELDIDSIQNEIEEEEERLLLEANRLPQIQRAIAEQQIREMASILRNIIKEMKEHGSSPVMISQVVKKELNDIRSSSENFFRQCQSHGLNTIKTAEKINELASNISNYAGHEPFSDFKPCPGQGLPKDSLLDFMKANRSTNSASDVQNKVKKKEITAKELMASDPLWAMKRSNIEQNMALASMGATAIDYLIEKPVGYLVGKFCQMNPTTEKICIKTAETVGQVLAPLQRPSKSEALADVLEEHYLIPREQARQYNENAFKVGSFTVLSLAGVGAGSLVRSGIAKIAITSPAEGSLAANAINSPTQQLALMAPLPRPALPAPLLRLAPPKVSESPAANIAAPTRISVTENSNILTPGIPQSLKNKTPANDNYAFIPITKKDCKINLGDGAYVGLSHVMKTDGSMTVFVKTILNSSPAQTQTNKSVFNALTQIQNLARKEGATSLYFQSANSKILDVAMKSKRVKFLGKEPAPLSKRPLETYPKFKMKSFKNELKE